MATLLHRVISTANPIVNITKQSINLSMPTLSPQQANVRAALYAVIGVMSVLGNIPILIIICKTPSLRTHSNIFIVNLAVSDIFNGAVKDVLIIMGVAPGRFIYGSTFCDISGFAIGLPHTVTMLTLMFIAIFRYITVVHGRHITLTKKHVWIAVISTWIYGVIDAILPIVGWSNYEFSPFEFACLAAFDLKPPSHTIFLMVTVTAIPFAVITYCYVSVSISIFVHDRKLKRQILQEGSQQSNFQAQLRRREIRATWRMFVVYLAFAICFLPWAVVVLILLPSGYYFSLDVIFVTGYLINLNSAINPFIYCGIYPKIRRGYRRLLCNHGLQETETMTVTSRTIKVVPAWQ